MENKPHQYINKQEDDYIQNLKNFLKKKNRKSSEKEELNKNDDSSESLENYEKQAINLIRDLDKQTEIKFNSKKSQTSSTINTNNYIIDQGHYSVESLTGNLNNKLTQKEPLNADHKTNNFGQSNQPSRIHSHVNHNYRYLNNAYDHASFQSNGQYAWNQAQSNYSNPFQMLPSDVNVRKASNLTDWYAMRENQILRPGLFPDFSSTEQRNNTDNYRINTIRKDIEVIEGDWVCRHCGNFNFKHRRNCNRCKINKNL